MLHTIFQAAENFCIHQIREPYQISDTLEKTRTLIAYIDIETAIHTKYRVYIASEAAFVQKVARIFLEEDESDEDTLIDMALETVNLIVGSAKVLAQESDDEEFSISTPHFVSFDLFDTACEQVRVFTMGSDKMIIAMKEIDG